MKEEKSLNIKFNRNEIIFNYTIFKFSNNLNYLLIIPGWQAVQEIFFELINTSKLNTIIFDYPGIGKNKHIKKSLVKKNTEIILAFTSKIQKEYKIDKVLGTSAGTAFIADNLEQFRNVKKIFLLSPQLSLTLQDRILNNIFKLIEFLQRIFKLSIYHNLINLKLIKHVWVNAVGKGSKRKKTFEFIQKGMKVSDSNWTLQQYFDLIKAKEQVKRKIGKIQKDKKIHFIIGKSDSVFDRKHFQKNFSKVQKDRVHFIEGSHVLELEAIHRLSKILRG